MFRLFIFYCKYEKGILMHVHNSDLKNEELLSFEKVQVVASLKQSDGGGSFILFVSSELF